MIATTLLPFAMAQDEPGFPEGDFTFDPAGQLVEGSGEGRQDDTIYLPGIRFPIAAAPAYLNSQVWGNGGSEGPGGRQCDEPNYSYPWRDNYCETRTFSMPLCPSGQGHQGQDIRPATCENDVHWAVAVTDGTIARIGSFSVTLIDDEGTEYRYLHLEPSSLLISLGQRVGRGDRIGRVSNTFFDSSGNRVPTTIHLHFDVQMNLDGQNVFVPPYQSLVESYRALLHSPESRCDPVPPEGRVISEVEGCVEWFGPAQFWRREQLEDADEGTLYWTNAHSGDSASNFARFRMEPEQAGRYAVEVNIVAPRNRATQVPYDIRHGGTTDRVVLDQSAATGWIRLGVYAFEAGGEQWLTVSDATGEDGTDLNIGVDAIRLVPEQSE